MSEISGSETPFSSLEQFRDEHFNNVYWVHGKGLEPLTNYYLDQQLPYGLEVGFGKSPTRVGLLRPEIDWFLAERTGYAGVAETLDDIWDSEQDRPKNSYFINTAASSTLIDNAQIVLYRNPNHETMSPLIPSMDKVRPGQEVIMVVDTVHIKEIEEYRQLLKGKGFNPALLKPIEGRELSFKKTEDPKGYIFRFKKPEETTD